MTPSVLCAAIPSPKTSHLPGAVCFNASDAEPNEEPHASCCQREEPASSVEDDKGCVRH